ncbi:MAG: hypothetical protein H6834_05635 [Planctomycetes bacterium]|nr:hypothetical protein [Planctomycetota bacterium]MCB9890874.1 hypothetical protein [Planctomycetota bacterium]
MSLSAHRTSSFFWFSSKVLYPWALLALTACSGGSGASVNRFTLVSTNGLENESTWQLNRAIELTFSQPVDLSTANLNSVQIHTVVGSRPALGTFFLKAGSGSKTLVFQPNCPSNEALYDGGFDPGPVGGAGVRYRLTLPTAQSRSTTLLRSTTGDLLSLGGTREFVTPGSPTEYFLDPRPNAPPTLIDISLGAASVFPDPTTGGVPGTAIPIGLNTFTEPMDPIVLMFDQPLYPAGGNVSSRTMRLLYEPTLGQIVELPTTITLLENCTPTGSRVLLSPVGILPPGATLWLEIKRELRDIAGERNLADFVPLRFEVAAAVTTFLDEFRETFDDTTWLDDDATFPEPRAEWTDTGYLQPATAFEGTNPDFDWTVDTQITIDTNFDTITNAAGTQTIPVVNGVIDVNDVTIGPNAQIIARGTNPLTILATGSVTIRGTIYADGTNSNGVNTLCTAFIPETGAPGQAGGGKGGDGSWETTTSTPRGGAGNGPYDDPLSGGQGGESGYGGRGRLQEDMHRPRGGGGGTLGSLGTQGVDGATTSFGAETQQSPPRGGLPGPTPFIDGDATNDFFGIRVDAQTGRVTYGELVIPFGGQGGGAGGDAIQWTGFPNPAWNDPNPNQTACDMKGAGGGGGAGILIIKALGTLDIQGAELSANGGSGGGGETAPGIGNRVGGGSGGGSGGHILLMSGTNILATGANVHARGGAGGIGAQTTGISAGGAGGLGVIQYHVPDPAQNLVPSSPPGVPAPWVLVPDFGALSTAQTKWVGTGFTQAGSGSIPVPPNYVFPGGQFPGIDPATGLVQRTTSDAVLQPGVRYARRVARAAFGTSTFANRLTIEGELELLSNPAILVGWELRDENAGSSAPFFTIVAARYQDGNTVLDVDRNDLPFVVGTTQRQPLVDQFQFVSDMAIVGLHPRFYGIETDGVDDAYPSNATVRFTFQGANADPNDPTRPDLTTLVPDPNDPRVFTGDVTDLIGKEFFRVRIQFDLAADGTPLRRDTKRPRLHYFALPFEF